MFKAGCRWRHALLLCMLVLAAAAAAEAAVGPDLSKGPVTVRDVEFPFATVEGSIDSRYEVHLFRFVAEAGDEMTAWAAASSIGSELVPMLFLYDASKNVIAYNDTARSLAAGNSEQDPILYLKIPKAGSYYIGVASVKNFRRDPTLTPEGTTGTYELAIFYKFDGPAIDDDNEPNDSLDRAAPIALPYRSHGTNLTYFGDIDWYSFKGKAGQRISIDIDAQNQQATSWTPFFVSPRVAVFNLCGDVLQMVPPGRDPDDGSTVDPALTYVLPRNCVYYIAVASGFDEKFDGPYDDEAYLADPYLCTDCGRIGYYHLQVRELQGFYFAQVANGSFGGWSFATSVILINPQVYEATGSVNLFKSDGTGLAAFMTEGGEAVSTRYFRIPARGSVVLKTTGEGEGVSGYAAVEATAPIGGSSVFSQFDSEGKLLTEAGVGAAKPMDFLTIPVDLTGGYNTGVALANPWAGEPANLYLKLLDTEGRLLATREIRLEAGKQLAQFVSGAGQLFPGLSNIRGSLQVLSDNLVVAVALRTSERTLTTLPPAAMNQKREASKLYFPHLVAGSSGKFYRSTMIISNPLYYAVGATLRFTRSDGTPMPVRIGSVVSPEHSLTLKQQATQFIDILPSGGLRIFESGYAVVEAETGVGGVLIFSQFDAPGGALETEVGVEPAPFYKEFFLFAQAEGDYSTGLAMANINPAGAEFDVKLRASGAPSGEYVERFPPDLPAANHRAQLVAGSGQLFPDFTGEGTLHVLSSVSLPAVTLRVTPTTLTALPVVPIP